MADAKQVKIAFAVDAKGLQDARRAIRDLTSDVQKLVETMGRAGAGMGSLLGGVSGKSGPINTRQEAIKLPGVGSSLAGSITKDAQALGQVARAGSSAMDQLTRSLKSNFSGQIQDIERLRRELNSLDEAYKKIKADSNSTLGQEARAATMGVRRTEILRELAGHQETRDVTRGYSEAADPRSGSSQKRNVGFWGGIASGLSFGQAGGWGGGGPDAGGNERPNGGGGTSSIERLAAYTKVFGTSARLAGRALNAINAAEVSSAQYAVDQGMVQGRVGARIGNSLGGAATSIRGGNLALTLAMREVLGSGMANQQLGAPNNANRFLLAQQAAGQTVTVGHGLAWASDYAGRSMSNVKGLFTGSYSNLDPLNEVAMRRQLAEMPAKKMEELTEAANNRMASTARRTMLFESITANVGDERETTRTRGGSMGRNKQAIELERLRAQGSGSPLYVNALAANAVEAGTNPGDYEARARAKGYSGAAWAGAEQALGHAAGWGLRFAGPSMLSAQQGGFTTANQVYGAGAQFGAPGALFNTAQAAMGYGHGGVDATAGSGISGAFAQHVLGGNFAGSDGTSALAGLLGAVRVGGNGVPGDDMRMARILQAGIGASGRELNGRTDRLQTGINMLGAVNSGAKGWQAQKMLLDMDPMQNLDIMRGGPMPEHFTRAGITREMVRKHNQFIDAHATPRAVGLGGEVADTVAGVRAAGGTKKYLHQLLDGKTSGRNEILNRVVSDMATATQRRDETRADAEGRVRINISQDKDLVPDLKGGGAWASKLQGRYKATAENDAKAKRDESRFAAINDEGIQGLIKSMNPFSAALYKMTTDVSRDGKSFDTALVALTASIMNAIAAIDPKRAKALRDEAAAAEKALKLKAVAKEERARAEAIDPTGTFARTNAAIEDLAEKQGM